MATGRKRQRPQSANDHRHDDNRWAGAVRLPFSYGHLSASGNNATSKKDESTVVEVSGFESSTGTLFARIWIDQKESQDDGDNSDNTQQCYRRRVEDVVETIVQEIVLRTKQETSQEHPTNIEVTNTNDFRRQSPYTSTRTLLGLGTVWILDPSSVDRPQNKPIWKRILLEHEADSDDPTAFWFDRGMTLRIHSRPSRFPMAKMFERVLKEQEIESHSTIGAGGIVFERAIDSSIDGGTKIPAFAVLHKPIGLPSHSTVDNAIENLLHLYQKHRQLEYASLPQRLDTETSGLVLVATHPRFASYFSKLLEKKTKGSESARLDQQYPSIQKRYRCLVAVPKDSWEKVSDSLQKNYIQSESIVEHYLNANSKAPKTFVPATQIDVTKKKTNPQNCGSTPKWQLCRLRIANMSGPFQQSKASIELSSVCCFELEIELLTGRTHQIRGQLAALGCPIVGDPLYGKESTPGEPKMALQCCALSFPMDESVECNLLKPKPKRGKRFGTRARDQIHWNASNTIHRLDFRLASAWWRDSIEHIR